MHSQTSNDLRNRKKSDFRDLPIDKFLDNADGRSGKINEAFKDAYADLIKTIMTCVRGEQSILIYGSSMLAKPLTDILGKELPGYKLSRVSIPEIRDNSTDMRIVKPPFASRNQIVVDQPLDRALNTLQAAFSSQKSGIILILDFLDDVFLKAPPDWQADLSYLLRAFEYRSCQIIGFVNPHTAFPEAVKQRFVVHLAIPHLKREQIWRLLSCADVEKLALQPALSVGDQILLHHLVARMDVIRFRDMIDQYKTHRFPIFKETVRHLKELMFPSEMNGSGSKLPDPLREIVSRFLGYYDSQTREEVITLDKTIPYTILIQGAPERFRTIAEEFAWELGATLKITTGANIYQANEFFRKVYPLPGVICIEDFDRGFLRNQEPLGGFIDAWKNHDPLEPVFILAHVQQGIDIPDDINRWFQLSLEVSDH